MHTDAQQTAALHAIPAFAEWARARGFRPLDVVRHTNGHRYAIMTAREDDPENVRGLRVYDDDCSVFVEHAWTLAVANLQLIPTEIDLEDFLNAEKLTICHSDALGYTAYTPMYGGEGWYDTRLGALVAAVEAVGGNTDER